MLVTNIGCKITKKNPNSTIIIAINANKVLFYHYRSHKQATATAQTNKHSERVYV